LLVKYPAEAGKSLSEQLSVSRRWLASLDGTVKSGIARVHKLFQTHRV
jgi:hypothetical protein